MLKRLLPYFIVLIPFTSLCQEDFSFSSLGISEGLSNAFVNDIKEDKKGFIWIATANGLNRYDGYDIKTFQNDPLDSNSLSFNHITSIEVSENGDLWLGSLGGGLIHYNYQKNIFKPVIPQDSIIASNLNGIINLKIENENLWIAGGKGVFKHNIKSNTFTSFKLFNKNPHNIQEIIIAKNGAVYAASNGGGLFELEKDKKEFVQYTHLKPTPAHNYNQLFAIYEDSNDEIWFGSFLGGLHHFNKTSKEITYYPNPYFVEGSYKKGIIDIKGLSTSTLILGLNGGGFILFDKENKLFKKLQNHNEFDKLSIADNYVPCIFMDSRGIIWFGTETGGCSIYNPNEKKFKAIQPTSQNGLSDKTINTFYKTDSTIWIGTEGGYINAFNPKTLTCKAYLVPNYRSPKQGIWIRSINSLNKNELIIGSSMGGFCRFNIVEEKFYPFPAITHDCLTMVKDSTDKIWCGTYQGVHSFKKNQSKAYFHSGYTQLVNQSAMTLRVIGNEIWAGYVGEGIHIINIKTDKFYRALSNDPDNLNSLSSNFVNCIYQDKKGRIWVGTQNGLNLYNKTDSTFTAFFTKNGLSSNEIYGILEDENGNLWISTSFGLNKFTPETKTFKTYFESDGLQSNQFRSNSYYKDNNGFMYFGGINGFNYFHPDNINSKTEGGALAFTGFQIFNKTVSIGNNSVLPTSLEYIDELTLSHKDYIFSFEFALLNYSLVEKNKYRYKLEGFTDSWNEIGNRRFISFTSLPDGDYLLHIQGANSDGVWSPNELKLKITITPPFYRTWLFYLLCVISGLFMTYLIFMYRLRAIQIQKNKLEELVDTRTVELKTQKEIVEHKNDEILSSLNYAKRIQKAILPPDKLITQHLAQSFVLYKPKDIVAGDFYWLETVKDAILFAAADCTGHGVPGAMVSVICNNGLNRSVREYGLTDPGEILSKTRSLVIAEFEKSEDKVNDGMDIALCSLKGNELKYAGAHNPLWIIRKNSNLIEEIKANKQPIGQFDNPEPYNTHTLNLEKGDTIYIFSDGFVDQFGGPKGKKYKAAAFRKKLLSVQEKSMQEQMTILNQEFETWKGSLEQVDDVCVIGIKI